MSTNRFTRLVMNIDLDAENLVGHRHEERVQLIRPIDRTWTRHAFAPTFLGAAIRNKRSIIQFGLKANIDRLALPAQHCWVGLTVVYIRKPRA